jgi:hypothetical protein
VEECVCACRSVVDGGQGSKVASEQMQPLFEVKNIVQQNSQRLAGLEQRAKVTPPPSHVPLDEHSPLILGSSCTSVPHCDL